MMKKAERIEEALQELFFEWWYQMVLNDEIALKTMDVNFEKSDKHFQAGGDYSQMLETLEKVYQRAKVTIPQRKLDSLERKARRDAKKILEGEM